MAKRLWSLSNARELCIRLERIAPRFGAHIALTGGTLYNEGERKDVDILVYRIRQIDKIDVNGFLMEIQALLPILINNDYGWCVKGVTTSDEYGTSIDFFFPERLDGPRPSNDSGY